eukprot:UN19828
MIPTVAAGSPLAVMSQAACFNSTRLTLIMKRVVKRVGSQRQRVLGDGGLLGLRGLLAT